MGSLGATVTPAFHLFDRVAAAIGGRRRRPVNSLAQCQSCRSDDSIRVRGICLDHHVLLFVRIGAAGDGSFSSTASFPFMSRR